MKFFIFSLLIATSCAFVLFQGEQDDPEAMSCDNHPCAPYEVVCESSEYEVRDYSQSTWCSVTVKSFSRSFAVAEALKKLAKYVKGANADGVHVNFGLPILTQIHADKEALHEFKETHLLKNREFSTAIYCPDHPPEPTDHDVKIDTLPSMRMMVKSFGGWSIGMNKVLTAKYLAQKLKANEEIFDPEWWYFATYNRPLDMTNRLNEVWVVSPKFSTPACARVPLVDNNIEEEETIYDVVETYPNGIEERHYPGGNFLTYTVDASICTIREALQSAFTEIKKKMERIRKLKPDFKAEGALIFKVSKRKDRMAGCDKKFQLLFHVEERPAQRFGLKFEHFDERNAYAFDIEGYFRVVAQENRGKFREALDAIGACYNDEEFYLAIHQKPSKLFHRKNTILFPAVDCKRKFYW